MYSRLCTNVCRQFRHKWLTFRFEPIAFYTCFCVRKPNLPYNASQVWNLLVINFDLQSLWRISEDFFKMKISFRNIRWYWFSLRTTNWLFYFGMHFLFLFGQTFVWPLTTIITFFFVVVIEKSCETKRALNVNDGKRYDPRSCNYDTETRFGSMNNFSYSIDFLVDAESICNTSFNSYQSSSNNNKNNNFSPSLSRFCVDDVFVFFSLAKRMILCGNNIELFFLSSVHFELNDWLNSETNVNIMNIHSFYIIYEGKICIMFILTSENISIFHCIILSFQKNPLCKYEGVLEIINIRLQRSHLKFFIS